MDENEILTPTQTLMIWALLARQGFAPQNDLGIAVDATERGALEDHGLVSQVIREQNAIWLRLEEPGWTWAGAHLAKALPPAQQVLYHFMQRLDAHLKASGETLEDFIGSPPEAGPLDPELSA